MLLVMASRQKFDWKRYGTGHGVGWGINELINTLYT